MPFFCLVKTKAQGLSKDLGPLLGLYNRPVKVIGVAFSTPKEVRSPH
tara:strand:+ start:110 stop:250 length:141 start_codon:yes stop_codon:yes gene_type:complete